MSDKVCAHLASPDHYIFVGLDVGGSDLIASGDIKIKHGEPVAFTEKTLVFRDGSEMEADVVVMA